MDKEDLRYIYIQIDRQIDTHSITKPKKNEIMLFATTWMDLEGIIFNEIIERQRKTSPVSYPFYAESKKINKLI